MLDNYYEEIVRKRRERWIFWIAVLSLSTFLYLFFQGYYPYVKFDADKIEKKPQIVRAFGIVNVRSVPAPDSVWIWSKDMPAKELPNDDKGFFDFGDYSVTVEKAGYLTVPLSVRLSRENSFSISVIELFRAPIPKPFPFQADLAEDLGGGILLVRERPGAGSAAGTGELLGTGSSATGSTYRLLNAESFESVSKFRTDARYLGSGLFEKNGTILSYGARSGFEASDLRTASGTMAPLGTYCQNAKLRRGAIECPETGDRLYPHEMTLKDRILGVNGRIARYPDATVRIVGGKEAFEDAVPAGSGAKTSPAFKIAKRPYRFIDGTLRSAAGSGAVAEFLPIRDVSSVHEFGNDTLVYGKSEKGTALGIVDERGIVTDFGFGEIPAADVRLDPYHGAYLASDGKTLWILYKGAKEPIRLAEGKLLEIVGNSAIMERDETTYLVELSAGE